ncbi:Conserved membrane protein of uncharacterised function [Mycobacterium tuberculosis]|nr:Conserved membrane protein of uncharacterised function [Mycobacterium tuberculosis]
MERMLDAPEQDPVDPGDPASPPHGEAEQPLPGPRWPRALRASATRRALLLTALGGLLIAGLVTAIPAVGRAPERLGGLFRLPVRGAGRLHRQQSGAQHWRQDQRFVQPRRQW